MTFGFAYIIFSAFMGCLIPAIFSVLNKEYLDNTDTNEMVVPIACALCWPFIVIGAVCLAVGAGMGMASNYIAKKFIEFKKIGVK